MQHKFSRHIKLLICVTLYNEDQETLGKTLLGICEVCHSAPPQHVPQSMQGCCMLLDNSHSAHCHSPLLHGTACPSAASNLLPVPFRIALQNLEVLYRQYGRDGNKHGLDWQEVGVAIIQDGIAVCDPSVSAGSTVAVRTGSCSLLCWHGALATGWPGWGQAAVS